MRQVLRALTGHAPGSPQWLPASPLASAPKKRTPMCPAAAGAPPPIAAAVACVPFAGSPFACGRLWAAACAPDVGPAPGWAQAAGSGFVPSLEALGSSRSAPYLGCELGSGLWPAAPLAAVGAAGAA